MTTVPESPVSATPVPEAPVLVAPAPRPAVRQCPCQSGKFFNDCCGPFLAGKAVPRTVRQLMRSRFSAYALGGYGEYLIATWHPRSAGPLRAEDLQTSTLQWTDLEIIDFAQLGDRGRVEFKARFRDEDGVEHLHHENSAFLRQNGKWLYLDGKVRESVAR